MTVVGLGYQGRTQHELCEVLLALNVDILCDVRLTPISRKPGLSKTALGGAAREIGVNYVHLPALGNPKWNRAGFGGAIEELRTARDNFRRLLGDDPRAQASLRELREMAEGRTVALLCFEADESRCHRSVLLGEVLVSHHVALVG